MLLILKKALKIWTTKSFWRDIQNRRLMRNAESDGTCSACASRETSKGCGRATRPMKTRAATKGQSFCPTLSIQRLLTTWKRLRWRIAFPSRPLASSCLFSPRITKPLAFLGLWSSQTWARNLETLESSGIKKKNPAIITTYLIIRTLEIGSISCVTLPGDGKMRKIEWEKQIRLKLRRKHFSSMKLRITETFYPVYLTYHCIFMEKPSERNQKNIFIYFELKLSV